MEPKEQILKTRDDRGPVHLTQVDAAEGRDESFVLAEGGECSWAASPNPIFVSQLRARIEPWLTALFQSEHLSLLIGSGLTHAVHHLATSDRAAGMAARTFTVYNDKINAAAAHSARRTGRKDGNIEDQLRVANELLRGLEILTDGEKQHAEKTAQLRSDIVDIMREFAASILLTERGLITAPPESRAEAFNYLVSFLMSFASRTGTRDRLQIFTTNYDRLIEVGSETAGLHLVDRFIGSINPIFRSSRLDIDMHYNPPGIRGEPRYLEGVARFTKLHGSVDWVSTAGVIKRAGIPFGAQDIEPYIQAPGLAGATPLELMIYPNSAKDRETAAFPYVELFRDFATAICRPNNALIAYGYSFGDEHINRVIEDMLTIPSTHLVVISHSDPLGRIMSTYDRLGRHAQVTLLVGNHLGGFQQLVDNYLPKPAIDRTTFRMAELLRSRWTTTKPAESSDQEKAGEE